MEHTAVTSVAVPLDADACYQAILTHDARFDGAFFVGVATTGIYCRTICPAKTPRQDRCTFYPSAAAAERAGYRPCLRCRPELAPGSARVDAVGRLAARALSRIEDGALTETDVEGLAGEMGISGRHLRRVLLHEFGVTAIELAQTQRLLLAKRLLTDTDLPVTEIAFASGFSSLRRFNALFQERYRLAPTALRKARHANAAPRETLVCEVAYRPPLEWETLRDYVASRGYRGAETALGGRYMRTVALGKHRGWIAVAPPENARRFTLRVEVSATLAPALPAVLARVKRLFDVAAEPRRIAEHLGPLALAHPGLRVPGAFDGFEVALRCVLGQRISVRAATTLAGRFADVFGEPFETPFPELNRLAPSPARIAAAAPEEIAALGVPLGRANAILALARAAAEESLLLEPGADVDETTARLKELPGIGEWTAQYTAMRALAWPDAFPHTDLGIHKALGETNPKRVLEIAEAWRPWRAYAVMHLWKSLEERTAK